MTHLRYQQRLGMRFRGGTRSEPLLPGGPTVELPGTATKRLITVHVVKCDCVNCGSPSHRHLRPVGGPDDNGIVSEYRVEQTACGNEAQNDPIPEHEWYVPDPWGIYPDGTHKCPDCRTKAAVDNHHKANADHMRDVVKEHGPEVKHCDDCGYLVGGKQCTDNHADRIITVHARELARPFYQREQHRLGIKDWSHTLGHLNIPFGKAAQ